MSQSVPKQLPLLVLRPQFLVISLMVVAEVALEVLVHHAQRLLLVQVGSEFLHQQLEGLQLGILDLLGRNSLQFGLHQIVERRYFVHFSLVFFVEVHLRRLDILLFFDAENVELVVVGRRGQNQMLFVVVYSLELGGRMELVDSVD